MIYKKLFVQTTHTPCIVYLNIKSSALVKVYDHMFVITQRNTSLVKGNPLLRLLHHFNVKASKKN